MLKAKSLWIILLLVFCLNSYGQEKEITRGEYFEATNTAYKKLYSYNRRVTTKVEDFTQHKTRASVYEVIRPDKSRWLSIVTENDVSIRTESIIIGNFLYQRVNDGEWTKTELGGNGIGIGNGIGATQDTIFRYTVTSVTLNNQSVQLFEENIITKYFLDKKRIWISTEGLILKSEQTTEEVKPNKLRTRIVTEYEYNPQDLKIEAPIK